jgi:glucose/arabinose dehydrogenase
VAPAKVRESRIVSGNLRAATRTGQLAGRTIDRPTFESSEMSAVPTRAPRAAVSGDRLLPDSAPGLPGFLVAGQGGLPDIVPHPHVAEDELVRVSRSKPNPNDRGGTTAVIGARFEDDRPNDAQGISTAKARSNGRAKHGSRLALDRDANLFITVGGPSKLVRMEPVPRG